MSDRMASVVAWLIIVAIIGVPLAIGLYVRHQAWDIKYECARAQRAGAQCVYVPQTGH